MNPITGVSQIIGSLSSIFGIGGSLANQVVIMHRELNQPQQTQVAQDNLRCPAGTRLVVLIKPNGERQLFCLQELQRQP
jgi:hypothetical protein